MRVLIVEDDPLVSSLVFNAVEDMQHEPVAVNSSEDAMNILAGKEEIDVLLADVMMHGISGIELAERSKALRPGLSIILTSGYPAEMLEIPEHCLFIAKPFAISELARLIEIVT